MERAQNGVELAERPARRAIGRAARRAVLSMVDWNDDDGTNRVKCDSESVCHMSHGRCGIDLPLSPTQSHNKVYLCLLFSNPLPVQTTTADVCHLHLRNMPSTLKCYLDYRIRHAFTNVTLHVLSGGKLDESHETQVV